MLQTGKSMTCLWAFKCTVPYIQFFLNVFTFLSFTLLYLTLLLSVWFDYNIVCFMTWTCEIQHFFSCVRVSKTNLPDTSNNRRHYTSETIPFLITNTKTYVPHVTHAHKHTRMHTHTHRFSMWNEKMISVWFPAKGADVIVSDNGFHMCSRALQPTQGPFIPLHITQASRSTRAR